MPPSQPGPTGRPTGQAVLTLTPAGLYCPAGDFYIDPWRGVPKAIITHAHSDHARWGSQHYLSTSDSIPLLKTRLGSDISIAGLEYGESTRIGSAMVSLHPAGHIFGSAQVRVEVGGEVWVVTGDFKRATTDPTCRPFEPLPCHGLVMESTFGLPVFRWRDDTIIQQQINNWWQENRAAGRCTMLYGYALGKAQRLLSMLDESIGPIFLHGALIRLTDIIRSAGIKLPPTQTVASVSQPHDWKGAMILAVPSAHGTPWARKFGTTQTGNASGWMQIRGNRRRRSFDRGFVLSDHADWAGLLDTVEECRPERVWVTHGYTDLLAKFLTEKGYDAVPLKTEFIGEVDDPQAVDEPVAESLESSDNDHQT